MWYHSESGGNKCTEVEEYDGDRDMYRVGVRDGWVAPRKLSLCEEASDSTAQRRKRRRTAEEGAATPAAAPAAEQVESVGAPPAPAAGGLSPSGPAAGPAASADGGLSPSTLALVAAGDVLQGTSTFSSYVTKAFEDLKNVGTPWEAMQANFASDQDALNKTLTAVRTKVFSLSLQ